MSKVEEKVRVWKNKKAKYFDGKEEGKNEWDKR